MDDDVSQGLGAVAADDAVLLDDQVPASVHWPAVNDPFFERGVRFSKIFQDGIEARLAGRDSVGSHAGRGIRHGSTLNADAPIEAGASNKRDRVS
jgi:hypothetical protein